MSDDVTTETRLLPCDMSTEEQRLRGIELAEAETALLAAELAKKAAAKEHKENVDVIQKCIYQLVKVVETGEEQRQVECRVERLFGEGVIRVTRTDTGEIVEESEMTEADRQLEMGQAKLEVAG